MTLFPLLMSLSLPHFKVHDRQVVTITCAIGLFVYTRTHAHTHTHTCAYSHTRTHIARTYPVSMDRAGEEGVPGFVGVTQDIRRQPVHRPGHSLPD
jgi:hypothetical protein